MENQAYQTHPRRKFLCIVKSPSIQTMNINFFSKFISYVCDLQGIRQRDEELASEVELLKHKLQELEQLTKGHGGLASVLNFRQAHTENGTPVKPA